MQMLSVKHTREILSIGTPTIVAMLAHTLMWSVDAALLGHVGSTELAAAGLAGILVWTLFCTCNNLSRVTNTFVSQANGRGDKHAIADYTWQGIYISLAAGIVLTLAGIYRDVALGWTGAPEPVRNLASIYIYYRLYSAAGTQLILCLSGYFQGRKRVWLPTHVMVFANVVNIALDFILIFGSPACSFAGISIPEIPAMGIKGAAIATSVSVWLGAVVMIYLVFSEKKARADYSIQVPRYPSLRRILDMCWVGLPSAVENFQDMLSFLFFTALVSHVGTVALAANQILIQILSLSFMPLYGLSVAGTIVLGNYLGERAPQKAEARGRTIYTLCISYSLVMSVVILLFGEQLFSIYTDDPEVYAFARDLMWVAAVFQVFDGLRMVSHGLLSGGGDTRIPMIISILFLWLLMVPGAYLGMTCWGWGLVSAWTYFTFCYLFISGAMILRYRQGVWKRLQIVSNWRKKAEPSI